MKKLISLMVFLGLALVWILRAQDGKNEIADTSNQVSVQETTHQPTVSEAFARYERKVEEQDRAPLNIKPRTPMENVKVFFVVSQRAIPLRKELEWMRKQMSDLNQIKNAFDLIRSPGVRYSEKAERERVFTIHFLERSLQWKQNPMRDFIAQEIRSLLLDYSSDTRVEKRMRRSIAADRAHLFIILSEQMPEISKEVRSLSKGRDMEKLINFTLNTYLKG